MRNIMASVAEVEYGTIVINAQTYVPIRTTLNEMGWKKGPTDIQVDNSTAVGISTKEFRQRNQSQWICDSIVSTTDLDRDDFEFSRDQAQKTWGAIIPNIIQLNIT